MEALRLNQIAESLREAGIRQAFTPDVGRYQNNRIMGDLWLVL